MGEKLGELIGVRLESFEWQVEKFGIYCFYSGVFLKVFERNIMVYCVLEK